MQQSIPAIEPVRPGRDGRLRGGGHTALDDELCVKRTIAGDGTLIRTTDANGNATRFWANARGQIALIENSQGDSLTPSLILPHSGFRTDSPARQSGEGIVALRRAVPLP